LSYDAQSAQSQKLQMTANPGLAQDTLYTVSQKKHVTTFSTITYNKCPITIIFGIVSSKSMSHRKMVSFPTSPI